MDHYRDPRRIPPANPAEVVPFEWERGEAMSGPIVVPSPDGRVSQGRVEHRTGTVTGFVRPGEVEDTAARSGGDSSRLETLCERVLWPGFEESLVT